MYKSPKALSSYGKIANAENNPLMQIVMLYDGAIKFLNLTATDIENNDVIAKAEHSNRALDIINYLHSILDFERGGEAAPVLDHFYRSLLVMILRASAELNAENMRKAAEMLASVRDAWEVNAKSSPSQELESAVVAASPAGQNANLTVKYAV